MGATATATYPQNISHTLLAQAHDQGQGQQRGRALARGHGKRRTRQDQSAADEGTPAARRMTRSTAATSVPTAASAGSSTAAKRGKDAQQKPSATYKKGPLIRHHISKWRNIWIQYVFCSQQLWCWVHNKKLRIQHKEVQTTYCLMIFLGQTRKRKRSANKGGDDGDGDEGSALAWDAGFGIQLAPDTQGDTPMMVPCSTSVRYLGPTTLSLLTLKPFNTEAF